MAPQGSDRLIVFLTLGAFLLVIALRGRHLLPVPIHRSHHGRLGATVDLAGDFATPKLPGAVVQRGHPQIERQAGFFGKPAFVTDLSRQLGGADGAKSGDGCQPSGQLGL